MSHKKLDDGNRGEDAAVSFLIRRGVQIVERNFRIRGGEIDIIGLDGDTLVFYEVKTRSSTQFGTPLEAISYWKLKALVRAAQVYSMTHPRLRRAQRIDAIGVMIARDGEVLSIELVKNVS